MKNYVLVSVSDKTNIIEFANFLYSKRLLYFKHGGTYEHLYDNLPDIRDRLEQVSDFTGFPEILSGRVKLFIPKYGGLLWDEKFNLKGITKIDMVVVNLYPFEDVISREDVDIENAIENIDIGGVSLI